MKKVMGTNLFCGICYSKGVASEYGGRGSDLEMPIT